MIKLELAELFDSFASLDHSQSCENEKYILLFSLFAFAIKTYVFYFVWTVFSILLFKKIQSSAMNLKSDSMISFDISKADIKVCLVCSPDIYYIQA